MRPPDREQDDRLEEGGLAGRVGPPDELWTGPEGEVERRVAPEIPDRE